MGQKWEVATTVSMEFNGSVVIKVRGTFATNCEKGGWRIYQSGGWWGVENGKWQQLVIIMGMGIPTGFW